MELGGSLGCGGGLPFFCWGPLDAQTRRGVHGRCSSSSLRPHPFQVAPFCVLLKVCVYFSAFSVLRALMALYVLLHAFSLNTDSMLHMLYTCCCMIFPFYVCCLSEPRY